MASTDRTLGLKFCPSEAGDLQIIL